VSRWRVVTAASFDKAIKRLDRPVARRVVEYLEALADLEDPRDRGKGLTGPLVGHWRYRVGDYRILVRITESEMTVLALDVAHRSAIYDR
jgi:mRNA interferase RelE/StbE